MRSNPYVVGPPLRGRQGFYGRQDIIAWVSAELSNPQTNALVLLGQRRIGKTSLLWQLQANLPRAQFLPVYFDLQDQATRPLGAVLADLADTLAEAAGLELTAPPVIDDRGRAFTHTFLPQVYAALPAGVRPVFLLDEFDVLDKVAEEGLAESSAAKAFFPFLRSLMSAEARPAFVFVVGRRADDLSLDFMSTFRASLQREVWVLDRPAAEAVIRQGEGPEGLRFTPEGVERILSLTGGHPYLIQLLCQRLWEARADEEAVTAAQVEAATGDALEMGGQALVWLWDGLAPAEKIYAAALAEIADEGETIGEDRVIWVITQHSARLRTREVELAPADLVKRRVLERVEGRAYRFAVELFRRWVRANKGLTNVKDEIDRVDALADQYFQIGFKLFNRRDWSAAQEEFKRALMRNERHFRARLYLGEALLELGQTAEAVKALEAAYKLDEVEARLPLVRGWLRLGQAQMQAGQHDDALESYARILNLSPAEPAALAGCARVWEQRGEAALTREDYPAALDAFEKAGLPQKQAEAQRRQRLAALQSLASQVEARLAGQAWAEAATAYRQLVELAPEEERWQAGLAQAQMELRLSEQYAEAQGYVQQGAWDKAKQTLVSVLGLRPDYRDAAELLVQVKRGRRYAPRLERLSPRAWAAVAAGLCLLAALGGLGWLNSHAKLSHATAAIGTLNAAVSTLVTQTPIPSPTPILTVLPASTLVPSVTRTRPRDNAVMVFVPAGTFTMGSTEADLHAREDEKPPHNVILDNFWMDKFEVTNSQYTLCVNAGNCAESSYAKSLPYNGQDQPVVGVTWQKAADYCAWAGARLPTEAEWEYVARGPENRLYPWGGQDPSCQLANLIGCVDRPADVGSYLAGASWVGALDMSGNVWEWVNDWYSDTYYNSSPNTNPLGPDKGTARVMRGGSWFNLWSTLRAANRDLNTPTNSNYYLGFRCASAPGS